MKKGLVVKYNENYHSENKWWIDFWKEERSTDDIDIVFKNGWEHDEQTHFPFPTHSSINRCLRLLEKLNNEHCS